MKLKQLLKEMNLAQIIGSGSTEVMGVAYDSRQVRPGFVFVAIPGCQLNGADYISDAIKRGAGVIVSEEGFTPGRGITHVQVPDARGALAYISGAFYEWPAAAMQTFGVTGTNGKTTVSFMIRDVLKVAGRRPGLLGTVRYEIGDHWVPASRTTPESADIHAMIHRMKTLQCDSLVLEVSSHAIVQERVAHIEFDAAVFTNLTHEHLDYHGSMECYFLAKQRLFTGLAAQQKTAVAVINLDDEWGRRLFREHVGSSKIGYGFDARAEVRGSAAKLSLEGTVFQADTPWGRLELRLRLPGRFNMHNALAAVAAAGAAGLPPEAIVQGLEGLQTVPGRLDPVATRGRRVFIDYAHTSDALENVLRTLREITSDRIVLVFGCGGNRDKDKRRKMGAIAARLADYSVITNDNPRREEPGVIVAQIMEGFDSTDQYEVVFDREEAIARGLELTRRGDVLLVTGKGHENYQEFADTVVPFSDREVVERLLGVKGGD